jgi:malonyl-CoA O-methyltransferase
VLVPINATELMIDLIVRLEYPALIVARSGLGTINHTLLTLNALRSRAIAVAGVVMVGEPSAGNRDAIERYGRVPVIGELPRLERLEAASLAAAASNWNLSCANLQPPAAGAKKP